MSRQQVKLVYQIGTDAWVGCYEDVRYQVARLASSMCGGCTIIEGAGFWMEDGAERKETFSASLAEEDVLSLELTCELSKVNKVARLMEQGIAKVFSEYPEIDVDWVHVSQVPITGRHFSVKAINSEG